MSVKGPLLQKCYSLAQRDLKILILRKNIIVSMNGLR